MKELKLIHLKKTQNTDFSPAIRANAPRFAGKTLEIKD